MPAANPLVVDRIDHGPTLSQRHADASRRSETGDPLVDERLATITAMADLATRSYGADINALIDARNSALADLSLYRQSCRDQHQEPDEAEIDRLEARIDRATNTLDIANKELRRHPMTLPGIASECHRVVGRMKRAGETITWHGDVKAPRDATVDSIRREIDALMARRDEAETALPDLDTALRQVHADIDRLAGDDIGLDIEVPRGDQSGRALRPPRVRVSLPQERIRTPDNMPGQGHVTSAIGIVAALFGDQLHAIVEKRVRDLYEGHALVMTDAERRKAIAKIDADILALSRIEAELGWNEIKATGKASFRSDIDPRAVLGID